MWYLVKVSQIDRLVEFPVGGSCNLSRAARNRAHSDWVMSRYSLRVEIAVHSSFSDWPARTARISAIHHMVTALTPSCGSVFSAGALTYEPPS